MITVKILKHGEKFAGFDVSGHSGYAESGSDIVCAAVSSAVSLCEEIISSGFGAKAQVSVFEENARVVLKLSEEAVSCERVLSSFAACMKSLSEDYPKNIEVLEVQSNA